MSPEIRPKSFGTFEKRAPGPTGTRTLPDLCDAGAVLYELSYQANWELAVTWVNDCVG